MYIGSWKIDDVVTFSVNTHSPTTGGEIDADAVPAYRVYEDETGTPIVTGNMALLDDTNTVGHYSEQITLSAANGFEKGKSYNIRIRGVVGGIAGVATRTLQIEAEVDANRINWANIDNSTTAQNLSATNIDVDQVVASVSGAVGSVTGNVGGNVVGSVASVTGNVGGNVVGTVASVVGNVGGNVVGTVGSVVGAVGSVTGAVGSVTGNVGGNVTGSIGSLAIQAKADVNAEADTALSDYDAPTSAELVSEINSVQSDIAALNNITAASVWAVATRTLTAATNISGPIADQVWEEAIADHSGTVGSTAEALNAAGSAGDPWTTSLPGGYTGTQAGKILADVLVDTGTTLQTELDGIQADTEDIQTRIPATLTAQGNIKADALRWAGVATGSDGTYPVVTVAGFFTNLDGTVNITHDGSPINVSNINNITTPPSAVDIWAAATRTLTSAANITSTGGTTVPQTGDAFGVVNSGTHGNAALKTLIDAIDNFVDTEITALTSAVDNVPTNAELATAITTGLTTALTEGYRATGATGSVRDLLYEINQNITEFLISGLVKTTKKLDGTTTAKTYTLNSDPPTGITETT